MWPEEAAAIQESGRSLTELRSVGPFTAHFISAWLREAPDPPVPPPLRDGFITYAYARSVVDAHPEWRDVARADHQMHTDETDGSPTIQQMAATEAELAHPRGRIYNFRVGLSCDWQRVAHRAAETGTALEIDAYPDRQDLDVARLRIVAAEGAWVSIGTDAHTPAELVFLEIGIAAAILAGVSRGRVLNLLSPRELADRVGLIRATKRRDTNEGSTKWQGVSASASTRRRESPEARASSGARTEADSAPIRPTPAAASRRTSASRPRTPRRKG